MRKSLVLFGLSTLAILAGPLRAESLLGENYVNTSLGVTFFGDGFLSDTYGEGYDFDILGNFNLAPNMDISVDFDYRWAESDIAGGTSDLTQTSLNADLIYFFSPNETVNPYLNVGLGTIYTDYTVRQAGLTFELDDTDAALNLGLGLEFEASEAAYARLAFEYLTYGEVDVYDLIGVYGYGFTDRSLGAATLRYDLDSENVGLLFSYIHKI